MRARTVGRGPRRRASSSLRRSVACRRTGCPRSEPPTLLGGLCSFLVVAGHLVEARTRMVSTAAQDDPRNDSRGRSAPKQPVFFTARGAVRVLVRNPAKVEALAMRSPSSRGDLDVPAGIDAAMAGVTSVVLVNPAVPAQELNVVASAARAGVGHVVKASSKASADSPIARRRGQTEIEAGLAASGLPYTLLRSNAYMQNILALAPAIAKTSGFGSSAGKGLVGMVDARDVAAVAAEIATSPAVMSGDVLAQRP